MKENYLLTNGTIVDGTGEAAFQSDVLIRGDRLTILDSGSCSETATVIDCSGKVIAPGFIDVHSHMDYFAIKDKTECFHPFIGQGVTSIVAGNCGFSPFGHKCDAHPDNQYLMENTLFKEGHDPFHWHDFNGYRSQLESHGMVPNVLTLAGHGSCRTSLHGFDAKPLGQDKKAEMLRLLDESMQQGAAGVSLGLQYKPGVFAPMEELQDVAELVKKRGKILTVHAKAYSTLSGTYPPNPFGQHHNLRALDEILTLGRETGVKLQYSHLLFAGKNTWPTMEAALQRFDQAIDDGVDVKFDIFPYTFGMGLLNTVLPEWVMAGMPGILKKRLPILRLRAELELGFRLVGFGYDTLQISDAACDEYRDFNGMFIADIAKKVNKSGFQVLLDLLYLSKAETRVIFHRFYDEPMTAELMKHRACMFMTDAWPEPTGVQFAATYGSFPKFLSIARDTGCLTLEQVVARMTGQAAERFELTGRGVLKNGNIADLVVFDWDNVKDNTSFNNSDAKPSGITKVFVNGQLVMDGENQFNDVTNGKFLTV